MKNNLLTITLMATLAPSTNLLFAMGNPQSAAAQATVAQSQSLEVTKKAKDQADAKKKEADKELAIQKVVQAIQTKDLSGVQKYIDEGGDIDKDYSGRTLLQNCVYHNNIEAARLLVAHGALVNECGVEGYFPLTTALLKCNLEFANFFLDHGADIEKRSDGDTALITAVGYACGVNSDTERVEYCKIVDLLMRRGANINAVGRYKVTPLLKTIAIDRHGDEDFVYDRLDLIKLLLRWGADYSSIKFECDSNLLQRTKRAMWKNNEQEKEAIEQLKKYLKDFPALWNETAITECLRHLQVQQSEKAKTDLESVMASFIVEPNTQEFRTKEKIYEAVCEGKSLTVTGLLLSRPSLLESRDATGYTPLLTLIYQCGDSMKARMVIGAFCLAGADIDAQNNYGQTAYMIADQQLKRGCYDDDTYASIKSTLNHHRAEREEVKLAKLKADEERAKKEETDALIEFDQLKRAITDGDNNALSNCSESMLEKKGSTLLLHAAQRGRTAIVEKLLGQKVPVDKRNEEYHTALMVAAINCNVETVAVLLKHMTPEQIKMTLHDKTAYELAQEEAAKPGYEQRLEKYKQIMAMLDSYNNAAAASKK